MRSTAVIGLAAVLLLASPRASANVAAGSESGARVTGPRFVAGTKVQVLDEELAITCVEHEGAPRCRFSASYRITNPESTKEVVFAAFYGVRTSEVAVAIDGAAVPLAVPSGEVLAALDQAAYRKEDIKDASEFLSRLDPELKPDRFPFKLVVEPGATHTLRVTGTMDPGKRFEPRGYSVPAYQARHVLFSTDDSRDRLYDLVYLLGPIRSWKGTPNIRVTIRFPASWEPAEPFYTLQRAGPEVALSRWSVVREGNEKVATRTLGANAPGELPFAFRLSAPTVRIGGILLGVGSTLGDRIRLRVAGELAAPDWLLYSAAFETNVRDRFFVVPAIHAATSAIVIIPSIGAGLGMPIQLRPDARAGVRFQADVHLYPLGLFAAVDVYPKTSSLPSLTEMSVFFQLGL